jgi:hypothetical protein
MEDLNKLFDEKNVTESSKKLYLKNLERLNGGELKNLKFLNDEKKILEKIQKYKPNTQRTYIISVVSLLKSLSGEKKYKKLYDKYYPYLEELNKQLKTNTEKSEKETENWLTQEEIMKRLDELKEIIPTLKKKITESQFYELQKLMLLSLYTLQAPRRNKDYQDMLVVKKLHYNASHVNEPAPAGNILDLAGNRFIFSNYKTQKKYQTQEIPVAPALREIIDIYLKHHPLIKQLKTEPIPFIVNFHGEPYKNNNDFTRLLYKIFNKKIGASMLRKIFLTDKYSTTLKELNEDTNAMGTSTATAENHYIKNT